MKIKMKEIEVNYIQYGSGKKDIVLLHGWGQNIEMMQPLGDPFCEEYRITILDLPGFGKSTEPPTAWNIYEYSDFLGDFLAKLNVTCPILMGHSFGGRISICYAATHDVEKVVLFGAPCIRKQQAPSRKEKLFKRLKKVPGLNFVAEYAKKYIGSRDYKAASPIMRETLVKVVNEDLSASAKQIKVPTLLIWGDQDREAPVEEARELEGILQDAGLIVFPGCSHYAYLENLPQVIRILKEFL